MNKISIKPSIPVKKRYAQFEKSLNRWCEAQCKAMEDAISIVKQHKGLSVTKDLNLKNPYFFISQGRILYMQKVVCTPVKSQDDYRLTVLASEKPDDTDCQYVLEWEDISQDIIVLHDFMSSLYEYAQAN